MVPPGDYEILQTTKQADRVLFQGERVLWRRPVEKAVQDKTRTAIPAAKREEAGPVSAELFERLRALRTDLAREAHVPAYVIFHDATLRDMASKQPTTVEELLEVSGVGERKAEKYGRAVLEVIWNWKQTRCGD